MKTINIYVGNCKIDLLYEQGLHPKNQIEKVKQDLAKNEDNYTIYANAPYVVEAFNKYGKEKGYTIIGFLDKKKSKLEDIFNSLSKPFEKMVFGD